MLTRSISIPFLGERTQIRLDGYVHPRFVRVADALRRQLERSQGGAAVCVYHRGKPVVDLWGGKRDRAGRPWSEDTMSPSFSTTKGVASTMLHILVDRGLLDYDDRVARYWPEFAQAGKAEITVRHVLAHQSGLYHIRQMIDSADRMLDWEHMIGVIERAAPVHPPGTRTGYHGLTFGYLIGEIIQRITGKPFARVVQEEIAAPLGMDGLYIGAPPEVLPRAAELLWPERGFLASRASRSGGAFLDLTTATRAGTIVQQGLGWLGVNFDLASILDALAPRGIDSFDFSSHATLRATSPAANGLFTARALARMYAALAGGGTIDGVRLLSAATLARATELQPHPGPRAVIPFDMRWRLGYHGVLTSRGAPRNAFGHFGFGGSGAWCDPRRDLAVALIVNCGMGTPFGDLRIVRMGGAVLAALGHGRAGAA
jgi:CubicO group peptidase (beta-lactamase class C family)